MKGGGSFEESSTTPGVVYRYSSSWIHELESADHWLLYWQQQKLMEGRLKSGDRILEIGVGSGFTANYLRSKGYSVTTLDIDAEKKPDIRANIVTYPFPEEFDNILAFEVFEHIPFKEFQQLITGLRNACRSYLFLSVPRNERVRSRVSIKLPKLRERVWEWTTGKGGITEPHHFWEIDHAGITAQIFEKTIEEARFELTHKQKVLSRIFYAFRTAKGQVGAGAPS
jgi:SAM-dependent methyltransferase